MCLHCNFNYFSVDDVEDTQYKFAIKAKFEISKREPYLKKQAYNGLGDVKIVVFLRIIVP